MALLTMPSDYVVGTISLTNGSVDFTGTATAWLFVGLGEGDLLIDVAGATQFWAIIAEITSSTAGKLTRPWAGPDLVNVEYRMRFTSDGVRSTAQAAMLRQELGNGNIQALAGLDGSANQIAMFTGPGAMTLVPKTDLVSGAAYDVQVADLAARAAYDGQAQRFSVLVANTGDGRAAIYAKNTNASGDWSAPAYVTGPSVNITVGDVTELAYGATPTITPISGTGALELDFGLPGGPALSVGTVTRGDADVTSTPVAGGYELAFTIPAMEAQGDYASAAAYVASDVVQYQGSSWVALQDTTGNEPPAVPVTSNAFWQLFARAGNDGTGTVTSIVAGEGITVDSTDPENPIISGSVTDITVVSDRAELKALDTSDVSVALLTEPGREGKFIWRAGDYSAQITADTAEGIYLKADGVAATAGAWVRQYNELADVRWFGAVLDDATDDTSAFNVALAVARHVFFPVGRAYVADMVQIPTNGSLTGVNVSLSVFSVKADFNLPALCVVRLGAAEGTQKIDLVGFEFFQPTSAVRADMIQYPAAVGHRNIPRSRIGHIRISRGWNGIDASQNAGGATYDWIECGTLNIGLHIDGALDTMNLGRFRFWPFGMSVNANVGVVYRDDTTVACLIGRCDGLEGEIHAFRGIIHFNGNGASSAGRHLHALHLDGDGARIQVDAGVLDIDYCYYTKSNYTPLGHGFTVQGSSTRVTIGNLDITSTEDREPMIILSGSLSIGQGRFNFVNAGRRAILHQGGKLAINAMEFTAPGARTLEFIRSEAGDLHIGGDCYFTANGGTGPGINVAGASVAGQIGDIALNGRTLAINESAMVGGVKKTYRGYVSADATVSRLPPGWTVAKPSTGNYAIAHNLGLTQSRQFISAMVQNTATTGDVVVDQTNTHTNSLRLRTFSGGTAADLPFTFEVAYV